MKELQPLSIEVARELLNFAGDRAGPSGLAGMAERQLEGAVAVHNILAREGFAYLADEVGMGKTYVALGVAGLIRYFHPSLRVLYIAPRENIQRKWRKELGNFTARNWRYADHRVRTLHGTPVDGGMFCSSLYDWTLHAVRDPDRDAFVRLTSFSLPLSDRVDGRRTWSAKRDELLQLAPFLSKEDIPLQHRDKERFKRDYATVINRLLPHYDLVIIDEAHNLKHGRDSSAARNQMLARVLGTDGSDVQKRFDRVLFLSATPLESEFSELWRQLDLLGFGDSLKELCDTALEEEQRRTVASRFLVRRLTELSVGGNRYTKNMYRREWRLGGMQIHENPLSVPGARQQLIVALVQKKVAEILQDERFGARFQIGMLASFESFLETAKIKKKDDDDPIFDHEEQTRNQLEQQGIDSTALTQLAESYRRKFGAPLPHPKMDAVVASLSESLAKGQKTLVFVRRVASVPELCEKLAREYDSALRERLLAELPPPLHGDFEKAWGQYTAERNERGGRFQVASPEAEPSPEREDDLLADQDEAEDSGGNDTFFSWFFRGEGPSGFLSGASFQKNRLKGEGSAYSTFFEENYVWDLLGSPSAVLPSLAAAVDRPTEEVHRDVRARAYARITEVRRQRQPRLRIFRAYQEAALRMLAEFSETLRDRAVFVLRTRFPGRTPEVTGEAPASFSEAERYLSARTFFTELRSRPVLREAIWPSPRHTDFSHYFQEREVRRELISAVARLGHSFIDLWILAVTRIGSLRVGKRDEAADQVEQLIGDFLDRLEQQKESRGFHAYYELSEVGRNHDLIMSVNFPEAGRQPLTELARAFGTALSTQMPVGGMYGGVNARLVRQFRMPGYPIVLVTTDVLQEGEDLHTFCGRIVHYGISWTPSAMEQRTGRVDRIGCLIHRTLARLDRRPDPDQLLQVYYPYLADTVEKLQVDRVFRRMNEFVRLTHRGGDAGKDDSSIDTRESFVRPEEDVVPIETPLESAFPIQRRDLEGSRIELGDPGRTLDETVERFEQLTGALGDRVRVVWDAFHARGERYGTVFVERNKLLLPEDLRKPGEGAVRQQPFALHIRGSVSGLILIHGMSPVCIEPADDELALDLVDFQSELQNGVRICESPAGDKNQVLITVEDDILLHKDGTSVEELEDLLQRISVTADELEKWLLDHRDEPIDKFRANLRRETRRGQHSEAPRR